MLITDIVFLMLGGGLSGFLAGLLGIGGGMILVPLMILIFGRLGFNGDIVMHLAIATGMASVFFTSISAVIAHHRRGNINWKLVGMLSPGLMLGALVGGGKFFEAITGPWLSLGFSIFLIYSAIQMILNKSPNSSRSLPGLFGLFAFSVFAGIISSLLGAGGAFIMVPFMIWCNIKPHNAMASSSGLGFFIAASSALGYIYGGWGNHNLPEYSLGYVYMPALGCIVMTSIIGAPLGAKIVSKVEAPRLKRIFGFILLLIALFMLNESRKAFGF
jgi:uncharacterized protein